MSIGWPPRFDAAVQSMASLQGDGGESILDAIALEQRYGVSFWDALVIQSSRACRAEVLYSEDLSDGQVYDSVRVVSPFGPKTA